MSFQPKSSMKMKMMLGFSTGDFASASAAIVNSAKGIKIKSGRRMFIVIRPEELKVDYATRYRTSESVEVCFASVEGFDRAKYSLAIAVLATIAFESPHQARRATKPLPVA